MGLPDPLKSTPLCPTGFVGTSQKRRAINDLNPLVYSCLALPKILNHSDFGGDKTRYAKKVSLLSEVFPIHF